MIGSKYLQPAPAEKIPELRERVHQVPGAVAFLKELHEAGLFMGWRDLIHVGERRDLPDSVCGPFLKGDEFTRKEDDGNPRKHV